MDESLLELVRASGVELTREGAVWTGDCPFHDDHNGALLVDPANGHWQCDGACQTGGDAAAWRSKTEGITPVLDHPTAESPPRAEGPLPQFSSTADEQQLLHQIVDYYHQTLKENTGALNYLQKRRLDHPEVIDHFKLGFCDRSLGTRLPLKNRKEGGAIRGSLQRLGILKSSGHELLRGSVVVPVIEDGQVIQMYGRKVTHNLRAGTALHVYLPGERTALFNMEAVAISDELIVCPSIIDALTFWCAGYRNVTCAVGQDGFSDPHVQILQNCMPKRVLLAFAATDESNAAAERLAGTLTTVGIDAYRIELPAGLDVNDHAVKSDSPREVLGDAIRQAYWLGNGEHPVVKAEPVQEDNDVPEECLVEETQQDEVVPEATVVDALPEPAEVDAPLLPATVLPPSPTDLEVELKDNELIIHVEDRRYRIRGFEKNLSYDQLKINLLVSRGDALHVDTFDLYATRPRDAFIKHAAMELEVKEDILKKDLGRLLLKLEVLQEQNIREVLTPKPVQKDLTPQEREEAMTLLTAPNLIERLLDDYRQCGLVGEETNKLVGYLAALSRKLDKPMAVMIQSTSAAGKSALMEAVLAFIPEEERVQYSAMTGQSLFYMGDIDLKHKILAISEEEGASHAAYALRLLQSEGHLTIASTGKDPFTGKHTTHEYRVEGPVMIFSTTTAIDIDEELLSRCLVLSVNEERSQTRAIHDWQRYQETLDGMLATARREDILRRHRNAQRLLKPLKVVNPYAEQLTFLSDKTRTRRDHGKYLTLIRTIALLHQYQREVKTTYYQGRSLSYVEVTPEDIELANRIAHDVLGRSLDEMPPQTRHLLSLVDEMVRERCRAEHIGRQDCRFSRREVREYTGWGMTQLKVHLQRLEAMEYLLIHKGGRGKQIIYELLYNSEGQDGTPFLMGLLDVEGLKDAANRSGETDGKSATGRAGVGRLSGAGREGQYRHSPSSDAVSATEETESTENRLPVALPPAHRTDGLSQQSIGR